MFKTIFSLSLIGGLRFFGLFVVMPVIAIYATALQGNHNATFIGLAISAYAISQIIFQVPFGILGERYSKRLLIAIGLFIFMIGSLVCAYATNIEMVIIGRLIQGAGAIGSLVSAKIADLVNEEKRGTAMAIMGISIFISFILAMIIGPIVGVRFGVDKLFLLTAILSIIGIILLYVAIPKAPHLQYLTEEKLSYKKILLNKNLAILNISVLLQKFLMTFAFTIIPLMLLKHLGLQEERLWIVFALGAGFGFIALGPAMIIAEKRKSPKAVLIISIVIFLLSYIIMGMGDNTKNLSLFSSGVALFFCAFCIQEPILQNLASKYPKIYQKSTALGIFTTCGYIGSFCGGIIAGSLFDSASFSFIIYILIALMIVWLGILLMLNNPKNFENLYIALEDTKSENLSKMNGIIESYINKNENLLIIKFDNTKITKEQLLQSLNNGDLFDK